MIGAAHLVAVRHRLKKTIQMLIDAHVHVDRFEMVGESALASALDEINSRKIFSISNSMDLSSYERNKQIAEDCEYILPIFGIHPWNASQHVDCLGDLDDAIDSSPMIGEIGLDFYFVDDESEYPNQRKVLEYFFAASTRQNKIVNLHTKGAEKSILELLKQYELPRVIIHWYSGPFDIFNRLADMGIYFTFGIEVMYSEHIQAIARSVPSEQMLTETDNPGGPKAFIGRTGTPQLIEDVVVKMAELRNSKREEIISIVHSNMLHLIGDDPWFDDTNLHLLEPMENGA